MSSQLLEQLRALRLSQSASALESQWAQPGTYQSLSFEERLGLLLDQELLGRETSKINRLRKQARLRLQALPQHLAYAPERGLQRTQMAGLLTGNYLRLHQNVLLTGPTGCGKTFVACALGEQACQQHIPVRYYRLGRLLEELGAAHVDGSYQRQLQTLAKQELLLLDDWGLEKLSARQAADLLEVIEDRYQQGSTVIASQLPVSEWHKMVSNPTVADALLDRLIHHSHRIELKGESMRKVAQTDQ